VRDFTWRPLFHAHSHPAQIAPTAEQFVALVRESKTGLAPKKSRSRSGLDAATRERHVSYFGMV
jgi:hypothetical protein